MMKVALTFILLIAISFAAPFHVSTEVNVRNSYYRPSSSSYNAYSSEAPTTNEAKAPCSSSTSVDESYGFPVTSPTTYAAEVLSESHGSVPNTQPAPPEVAATPAVTPTVSKNPQEQSGTVAVAENGATVVVKGDNTLSLAADKDSGAASVNGEDTAFAAAAPGAALGVGLSSSARVHTQRTPCPTKNAYVSTGSTENSYIDASYGSEYSADEINDAPSSSVQPGNSGSYDRYVDSGVESNFEMYDNSDYSSNSYSHEHPQYETSQSSGTRKTPCPHQSNENHVDHTTNSELEDHQNHVHNDNKVNSDNPVKSTPVAAQVSSSTENPTTVPPETPSPTVDATNIDGTAAISKSGATVATRGDTTISVASDTESGAASANGGDLALAAAAPGNAVAVGLSSRQSYSETAAMPPVSTSAPCTAAQTDRPNAYKSEVEKDANDVSSNTEAKYRDGDYNAKSGYESSPSNSNHPHQENNYDFSAVPTKTPCPKKSGHGAYKKGEGTESIASDSDSVSLNGGNGYDVNHYPNNNKNTQSNDNAPIEQASEPSSGNPINPAPTPTSSPPPKEEGTAARAGNGATVQAKGDTTVSTASDKNTGSASANGDDVALAAAVTGAGVGISLSGTS